MIVVVVLEAVVVVLEAVVLVLVAATVVVSTKSYLLQLETFSLVEDLPANSVSSLKLLYFISAFSSLFSLCSHSSASRYPKYPSTSGRILYHPLKCHRNIVFSPQKYSNHYS